MPQVDDEDDPAADYGLGRVLALSDAVFAIALTLLVLSLQAEVDVGPDRLDEALKDTWPGLLAYGLSVAVIGAFWVGHHDFFGTVRAVDGGLLWANIAYLGLVALIPFPTDLLGRYGDRTDATVIYAATIGAVALASTGMSLYARRRGLTTGAAASHSLGALPVAVVFLVSIPVALWSTEAAKCVWILLVPAQLLSGRTLDRRTRATAT